MTLFCLVEGTSSLLPPVDGRGLTVLRMVSAYATPTVRRLEIVAYLSGNPFRVALHLFVVP